VVLARGLKQAVGDVVRELREERGISQEELSFRTGRHRTYVSLLERGKHSPSLDTVWLLADGLGVSPSEFVRMVESRLRGRRRA
jgi:transcriptional regulator with XRE-family HTH domain